VHTDWKAHAKKGRRASGYKSESRHHRRPSINHGRTKTGAPHSSVQEWRTRASHGGNPRSHEQSHKAKSKGALHYVPSNVRVLPRHMRSVAS
jgi:hypothetical protein